MKINDSQFTLLFVYSTLVFIWATTPLAIVWSVAEIHVMWVLVLRYSLASILALLLLYAMKDKLFFDRLSLMSYVAGSLNLIGAQFFIYLAAKYLSSGFMALLFGFSPLVAGLMGYFVFKNQVLNHWQWLGMGLAFIGLIFIFSDTSQTAVHPLGLILILISILFYITSIFWVKKISAPLSTLSQATGSLLVSMLASWVMIPFIYQSFPTQIPSIKGLLGFSFTVVFSSIIAMLCYFWLIKRIKPSSIAMSNIITPIIALGLGVMFNQEQLVLTAMIGVMIAMSGIALYFWAEKK